MHGQPQQSESRATSDHQQRVDELIAQVRAETAPPRPLFRPVPERPQPAGSALEQRIAEEIDFVRRHLDMLGSTLASDAFLVHRHAASLQSIDLMNQILNHLARVVESGDKTAAAEQVSHGDLRARLLRRSILR